VSGASAERSAHEAMALVGSMLSRWHVQFSRFLPHSELSRLNGDPRGEVPVSPLMARLAQAVSDAAAMTGGLVDATLIDEIERAGYSADLARPLPLIDALALAPARRSAAAAHSRRWLALDVDVERSLVRRPPGVKLDSGGLAKGLFADVLAQVLAGHRAVAVNCAGDVAIAGAGGAARAVNVESPFDGSTLHTFRVRRGGVATSGIGRRSWLDADGGPAHHLLDPATGRPAFTGIVQATALGPSALLAEIRAKAAILSGPRAAAAWLPDGGVIVLDDGSHNAVAPPAAVTLEDLAAYAAGARAARRYAPAR